MLRRMRTRVLGTALILIAIGDASGQRPIAELPAWVHAPEGVLTLFADFEHPNITTHGDVEYRTIPVYLVNRTETFCMVSMQDLDTYLKLEVQGEDGAWERAQPHKFSGCGNSYRSVRVPAEHYLQTQGWCPGEGTPANVRYRMHRQRFSVVSNVGRGMVPEGAVAAAANDMLAVVTNDKTKLRRIALNSDGLPQQWRSWHDPRITAIERLRELDPEAPRILRQILSQPDLPVPYMFAALGCMTPTERGEFEAAALADPRHVRRWDLLENVWNDRTGEALTNLVQSARGAELNRALALFCRRYLPERASVIHELRASLEPEQRSIADLLVQQYGHPIVDVVAGVHYPIPQRALRGPLEGPPNFASDPGPVRLHAGQRMFVRAWLFNRTDEAVAFRCANLADIMRVEVRNALGVVRTARPDQEPPDTELLLGAKPHRPLTLWFDWGKCFGDEHGHYTVRIYLDIPELGGQTVASQPLEVHVTVW